MRAQGQNFEKASRDHRVDKTLTKNADTTLDISRRLSVSTPLSLTEILDTINGFGAIGGLSEEELNSFRQQVLSLGLDNSSSSSTNSEKQNSVDNAALKFKSDHPRTDSANPVFRQSSQPKHANPGLKTAPQNSLKTKNFISSKRSGVFNRRGIGTIKGE